jgi:sulfide:quinone oxidoreductase
MNRHQVVVVGGGTAGITVAARLRRAGVSDVAVVEPSSTHHYQPLWTLIGGGRARANASTRPQRRVTPPGTRWYQDAAVGVDLASRTVRLDRTGPVGYEQLVVASGLQMDWDRIPGLPEALGHNGVSSNYAYDLAPKTWRFIRDLRSGTAIFTMPGGPVKCAGAPQKIAYLAADHWRRQGVLRDIHIVLALATPTLFKVPAYAEILHGVTRRYGIDVRLSTDLAEVNPDTREAVLLDVISGTKQAVPYDLMHVTPPQSAPDWIKAGPLAGPADPGGFVLVDKHTLQHPQYPDVFAVGDVANLPTSKTGAAVRKQAPVLVANLLAAREGRAPAARYNGYTSCPLVTARNRMLLAEFGYDVTPTPSLPLIDTMRERYDMWLLKRYGLPQFYWRLMLPGRA